MRSTQCLGAPDAPQIANRMASASVDFPLPRAPMMQVRPRGMLTLKPGRNPPLISIFSMNHIHPISAGDVDAKLHRLRNCSKSQNWNCRYVRYRVTEDTDLKRQHYLADWTLSARTINRFGAAPTK